MEIWRMKSLACWSRIDPILEAVAGAGDNGVLVKPRRSHLFQVLGFVNDPLAGVFHRQDPPPYWRRFSLFSYVYPRTLSSQASSVFTAVVSFARSALAVSACHSASCLAGMISRLPRLGYSNHRSQPARLSRIDRLPRRVLSSSERCSVYRFINGCVAAPSPHYRCLRRTL